MEKLIEKFLLHLDMNKDGKPDVEQLHNLADKVLPPFIRFVEAGGLLAIKMAIDPMLNAEARTALDELLALVHKI